jgi:hypothetical protein
MRNILFLLCVLGLPCLSLAQTSQSSWSTLSGLQPGQHIQLIDSASRKHSGTFLTVSDTAIAYREKSSDRSIEKQEVRSVKLMENKHRLRNTLIFAGVGAGVGAGIGAATTQQTTGSIILSVSREKGAAVGAVIGVVAGATVGALLPSNGTIYNVASH